MKLNIKPGKRRFLKSVLVAVLANGSCLCAALWWWLVEGSYEAALLIQNTVGVGIAAFTTLHCIKEWEYRNQP